MVLVSGHSRWQDKYCILVALVQIKSYIPQSVLAVSKKGATASRRFLLRAEDGDGFDSGNQLNTKPTL